MIFEKLFSKSSGSRMMSKSEYGNSGLSIVDIPVLVLCDWTAVVLPMEVVAQDELNAMAEALEQTTITHSHISNK